MVMPTRTEVRIETHGAEETRALAARLAAEAEAGDLLCLWGELGAGKTVFAKGFGEGLGVSATINSPSFVLMAEYPGRLPLFHLDLFRLRDETDVFGGGLIDDRQADGVTLVEWPERLGSLLPASRLDVRIAISGPEDRSIALHAAGEGMDRYLAEARR